MDVKKFIPRDGLIVSNWARSIYGDSNVGSVPQVKGDWLRPWPKKVDAPPIGELVVVKSREKRLEPGIIAIDGRHDYEWFVDGEPVARRCAYMRWDNRKPDAEITARRLF